MCLDRLTKVRGFNPSREVVGYRIVNLDTYGNLRPIFRGQGKYRVGQWLDEQGYNPGVEKIYVGYWDQSGKSYPPGFHAFKRKADAIQWAKDWAFPLSGENTYRLIRVKLKGVVAMGKQFLDVPPLAPTLVAKQMLIDKVYE